MLSPSMLRILRWLESYPSSLESAWDVPRSLSLEGIADGIGVVRSALHAPLNELLRKKLVVERKAHVIDCLLYTSPSPRDKRQSRVPWWA